MGKETGFIEFERENQSKRPVEERIKDFNQIYIPMNYEKVKIQAARCMDCGVPFCTSEYGCPLGNAAPEINDLVYRGQWKDALDRLLQTNNFPEFTGTVCPGLCEKACVLGAIKEPVGCKNMELSIINKAFEEGWITAKPPLVRVGKTVAVIGSGPAGLACADQLNKAGYDVTVFERDDVIGGLLVYGIPDFKLEKWVVDRRVDLLKQEGIKFKTNIWVGRDYPAKILKKEYDIIVLTGGATQARDLPIPGRSLKGLHFAVDYLKQQNKRNRGLEVDEDEILATNKNVIVIGGGDTANDCVGTAIRQGAKNVYQLQRSSESERDSKGASFWGKISAMTKNPVFEEGGIREYSVKPTAFSGEAGIVNKLHAIKLDENREEIADSDFEIECDLALFALGFLHPEHETLLGDLGVELDERGNVKTDEFKRTSVKGVYAAGDMRSGQSLVCKEISDGRKAARTIDLDIMGQTNLR